MSNTSGANPEIFDGIPEFHRARYLEMIEDAYFDMMRPKFGCLIWGVCYFACAVAVYYLVTKIDSFDYQTMQIINPRNAEALNQTYGLISFVLAIPLALIVVPLLQWQSTNRERILEDMYEPENSEVLSQAIDLARKKIQSEIRSENLRNARG